MDDKTMIYGFEHSSPADEDIAGLAKEIRVRVLNCSPVGCLVESHGAVPVGTVAVLRVGFGGQDFDDIVQVVRCQPIEGAGDVHHVGTRFLGATPPYAGTLRYVMQREMTKLSGSLRMKNPQ
jgi:hypothetical protein